jgi:AraC-like DNA-binding protein
MRKAMNQMEWERRRFERLEPDLSHDAPVFLWHGTQPHRQQLVFDMHYGCEVGIVCRGAMLRRYRDHERLVRAGGVWLCGLWEPHGGRVVQAPCETLAFAVLPEMLALTRYPEAPQVNWAAPFMAPPRLRPRVTARTAPQIMSLVRHLKLAMRRNGGLLPPLLGRFAVMEVLRVLLKDWRGDRGEVTAEAGRQINRAVHLAFSNKGPVTAPEAAKACGMSRSTFDRAFPKIMGMSFHAFALRQRLQGVAGQLLTTSEPLKAVALEWGFTDASHLIRRFADLFGCSPNEYRNTVVVNKGR